MGFPKIGGTFVWVPRIRIIVFWGLYWGPLVWEASIWRLQHYSGYKLCGLCLQSLSSTLYSLEVNHVDGNSTALISVALCAGLGQSQSLPLRSNWRQCNCSL